VRLISDNVPASRSITHFGHTATDTRKARRYQTDCLGLPSVEIVALPPSEGQDDKLIVTPELVQRIDKLGGINIRTESVHPAVVARLGGRRNSA
jgi:hypothetical protein